MLTMTRNHQETPVYTQEDRADAHGGKITPTVQRATRTAQTTRNTPKQERRTPLAASAPMVHNTDDLDDNEPSTEALAPIPARSKAVYTTTPPSAKRSAPTTNARYQKQAPRSSAPYWLLGMGAVGAIIAYTILFFFVVGYTTITNNLNYSPTHTSHMDSTNGTQHEHIVAYNLNGTVVVTVLLRDPTGKLTSFTYAETAQNKAAWNNDFEAIMPIIETTHNKIRIHLIGGFDYWHAFFRPTHTFDLIPNTNGGFTLVDETDQ